MTTSEGKVKKEVRQILQKYQVYWFQPVQMGYGPAGLDFHCVVRFGHLPLAFFVETKKPNGDWLTRRQELLANNLNKNFNAKVFVIDNEQDLERLETWLAKIQRQNKENEVSSRIIISQCQEA